VSDNARALLHRPSSHKYEQILPEDVPALPLEIYNRIIKDIDGLTLLNFGATCSFFANCIRDHRNPFQDMIAAPSERLSIVFRSELTMQSWMKDALNEMIPEWHHDFTGDLAQGPDQDSVVRMLFARSADAGALSKLLSNMILPRQQNFSLLA